MPAKLTREAFIEKARKAHGDKYNYDKVVYVNSQSKVTITCPDHGDFEQRPSDHQNGIGCVECGKLSKSSGLNGFIKKAKLIHGNQYDYSKVNYVNKYSRVIIICPIHGEFTQSARAHLYGRRGCKKCGFTKTSINKTMSVEQFLQKARKVHGDKYNYDNVLYVGSKTKVTITCPDHGDFEQIPNSHLMGTGCPKCANIGPSEAEQFVFELCESYAPDVEQSNRTAIAPLELDIYIPSLHLAIEFNGTYWHSEKYRHKKYHQEKFLKCQAAGIQLFQIWEHDWIDPVKQDIILSMLQYKLGHNKRIYARKTVCTEIDFRTAKAFYNEHHLQGAGRCHSKQSHYALMHNDEPVMVMSVDYTKNYIIRVATAKGLAVVGGASKLFKQLPSGDYMSYGSNDLGATLAHYPNAKRTITEPRYFWYRRGECVQRQKVQKHKLSKLYPDFDGSTEVAWMRGLGYHRVFDSGNTRLEFSVK